MERIWKLDGEQVNFKQMIRTAKKEGYKPDSGIYFTSEAAEILRKHGYTVECIEVKVV